MIRPKTDYIAEIIKQLAVVYKLSVAVVDADIMYDMEESWANLKEPPRAISEFLKLEKPKESLSLIEYTEKHVLMELMFGPLIQDYFVKYEFFPYTGHGLVGTEDGFYDSIIEGWKYYYEDYSEKLIKTINLLVTASHTKAKRPDSHPRSRRKVRK